MSEQNGERNQSEQLNTTKPRSDKGTSRKEKWIAEGKSIGKTEAKKDAFWYGLLGKLAGAALLMLAGYLWGTGGEYLYTLATSVVGLLCITISFFTPAS